MYLFDTVVQFFGVLITAYSVLILINQGQQSLVRTHKTNKRDAKVIGGFERKIESEMSKVRFKTQWEQSTWSEYRPFKVVRKEFENMNQDICSFYLEPANGKGITPFRPGQHIAVAVRPSEEEKPYIRCYSLSESPNNKNYYRISVRKNPGPNSASTALHETINPGDIINIQAPSGHFYLNTDTPRPVVMLAGGIGITPFISMAETLCDLPGQHDAWLFYGTKNRQDHVMYDNLKAIASNNADIKVRVCYSDAEPGDVEGEDYDYGERISIDLLKRVLPSNNYIFMICGPTPMQDALIQGLLDWGVPQNDIRYEFFGDPSTAMPVKSAVKIKFSQSDKELDWNGGPILNFAEENNISTIKRGCGVGVCGNCKVGIKSGSVEYSRDPIYEYLEEGDCLPCISVPNEDLVLDA